MDVTLREGDRHLARLELADRTRRILYDATEVGLRLEVDGRAYRFGWATTGHVRATAPAVVVALQVAAGDRVAAGQALGFLEAMKVEIAFAAPVAGIVSEIRAHRGQAVAAGEVLVVIEPRDQGLAVGSHRHHPEEGECRTAACAGSCLPCSLAALAAAPPGGSRRPCALYEIDGVRDVLDRTSITTRGAAIVEVDHGHVVASMTRREARRIRRLGYGVRRLRPPARRGAAAARGRGPATSPRRTPRTTTTPRR